VVTQLPRDAEATRARLLAAASAEFARYGIAGARVDRIAAAARSNKAQIYHYFTSKDGLFDAVFGQLVDYVLAEVPLDVDDLPGYAGKLFDGYQENPDVARLVAWQRLERGEGGALIRAVVDTNAAKVAAIAAGQRAGTVSAAEPPEIVLCLVVHMAALWTSLNPEYEQLAEGLDRERRRAVVTDAVAALVTPRPPAPPT
jgi:AcrR family transcriptional regulator